MIDTRQQLEKQIKAANQQIEPDYVLKNATYVNVFTERLETADIAVLNGIIVGIGTYTARTEIDLKGGILCPGFLDGHIHLESCMVAPREAEKAMLAHGTVAVITDPHEITNVAGIRGIDYMLEATKNLTMDVYFMLPSCVPAADLEESGAKVLASDLKKYYTNERVLGLAELMNAYGTVRAEESIVDKLMDVKANSKMIDGHAPGLAGTGLCAYITAGVSSDHECSDIEDAKNKIALGQWIMLREGTAAKNLEALMPLFDAPYYQRTMLVTDDRHPEDLLQEGHIDLIIRRAIKRGADPIRAIIMGSLHTATYFELRGYGAIAPGYRANFAFIDDFNHFHVKKVWMDGIVVAENGEYLLEEKHENPSEDLFSEIYHSFRIQKVTAEDFSTKEQLRELIDLTNKEEMIIERVIEILPGELLTNLLEIPVNYAMRENDGVDIAEDIVKIAVFERHHGTNRHSIGFLKGYGLKKGAIACSIAHDSHNLIVVGCNDSDMAAVANQVISMEGGIAIGKDGVIVDKQPLPIAGLMSTDTIQSVAEKNISLKEKARKLGVAEEIDPFMTLAFVSLPVIPKVRLNTCGLVNVEEQSILKIFEKVVS